jgi:hypothetical protein
MTNIETVTGQTVLPHETDWGDQLNGRHISEAIEYLQWLMGAIGDRELVIRYAGDGLEIELAKDVVNYEVGK